jgi:hypothetical protein
MANPSKYTGGYFEGSERRFTASPTTRAQGESPRGDGPERSGGFRQGVDGTGRTERAALGTLHLFGDAPVRLSECHTAPGCRQCWPVDTVRNIFVRRPSKSCGRARQWGGRMAVSGMFELQDIEWSYTESREIGRNSPQQIPTGLESANARCLSCGHEWRTTAGRGPGEFRSIALDSIRVVCPQCGADGTVQIPRSN